LGVSVVVTNEIASALGAHRPGGAGNGNRLSVLDSRELEVLRLLSLGLTNRQIAERIFYSVGTVKNVVQQVIEKLDVSDRTQAAEAVRVYLSNAGNAAQQ
jgi:two-component system response regulator DevR